ncbi:hypothetical protein QE152_g7684 [Popillia japonica]|uniref:Uncharacterized protein n=1 Tax=Popillia japonica TaxID=7064 RepID=A0AAW1MEG9_POPJA
MRPGGPGNIWTNLNDDDPGENKDMNWQRNTDSDIELEKDQAALSKINENIKKKKVCTQEEDNIKKLIHEISEREKAISMWNKEVTEFLNKIKKEREEVGKLKQLILGACSTKETTDVRTTKRTLTNTDEQTNREGPEE